MKKKNYNSENTLKVANLVWGLDSGGIEAIAVNLYKNMDRDRVLMDFVIDVDSSSIYDHVLNSLNAKKIVLFEQNEYLNKRFYKIRKSLKLLKLFKNGGYDVVYNNLSYPSTLMYGLVAKIAKIPKIVSHAHSTTPKTIGFINKKINEIQRFLFSGISDFNIAVSDESGKWIFGKRKYKIIPNGIDYNRFTYNNHFRGEIREKLQLDKSHILFGNIGRLSPPKNQFFLIDVFLRVHMENPATRLVIVGEGENEGKLKEYVNKCKLSNEVFFIGYTEAVEKYLSAMDIFLFPSIWEGFGIAAIEAQASGLITFVSDAVPNNAHISNKVFSFSLDKDIWVSNCLNIISNGDYIKRKATLNKELDIKIISKKIQLLLEE